MTFRTCDSSLPTSPAICGADMPVADAGKTIARLDSYFALLADRPQSRALLRRVLTYEHLRGTHAHLHTRDHASWFAAEHEIPVKRSRTTD